MFCVVVSYEKDRLIFYWAGDNKGVLRKSKNLSELNAYLEKNTTGVCNESLHERGMDIPYQRKTAPSKTTSTNISLQKPHLEIYGATKTAPTNISLQKTHLEIYRATKTAPTNISPQTPHLEIPNHNRSKVDYIIENGKVVGIGILMKPSTVSKMCIPVCMFVYTYVYLFQV